MNEEIVDGTPLRQARRRHASKESSEEDDGSDDESEDEIIRPARNSRRSNVINSDSEHEDNRSEPQSPIFSITPNPSQHLLSNNSMISNPPPPTPPPNQPVELLIKNELDLIQSVIDDEDLVFESLETLHENEATVLSNIFILSAAMSVILTVIRQYPDSSCKINKFIKEKFLRKWRSQMKTFASVSGSSLDGTSSNNPLTSTRLFPTPPQFTSQINNNSSSKFINSGFKLPERTYSEKPSEDQIDFEEETPKEDHFEVEEQTHKENGRQTGARPKTTRRRNVHLDQSNILTCSRSSRSVSSSTSVQAPKSKSKTRLESTDSTQASGKI